MATHLPSPSDLEDLDALTTEAVADSHLMLDELSVPELVTLMNDRDETVAAAVRAVLPAVSDAIAATVERMRRGGRLLYVGAGTSGRLGVLDASEVPPTFGTGPDVVIGIIAGGPAAIVSAVEAAEDDAEAGATDVDAHAVGELDTVVGIASSGRTPYVLGALVRASERGALTVGVACNTSTPLAEVADHGIELAVGPEVVTGSTRLGAATATKMVLNMFSTIAMVQLGKTYRTLMVDVKATNAKLRRRAVRIVTLATEIDDAVAERALEDAGWHAKLAIAMIATGLDADHARAALDDAGGVLRVVVDRASVDGDRPTTSEEPA
ncbi:N-acetylmuramic acid 6-phosphate etherase [Mumia sp. Pv 4-285]|uniref:N-acetylmuramic acid 6-phosphate etherase n=1 Tax=Mumia qirimensis TaxID=3234852 RepID=UPI00351CC5A0